MARININHAGGPNVCAFLDVIAFGEIGAALLTISDDGYNVLVGATAKAPKLFSNYNQHPNVYNAAMNSTAAGRYQFIHSTWAALQSRYHLPDFSPLCQDIGCIELLREGGAIQHILKGNISHALEIAAAINIEGHEWASLPSSNSGQPQRSMLELMHVYGAALARYASLSQAVGL